MRNVVVSEFITLDGVFGDPGGAEKTEHGGWSFKFWSDESATYKYDELFAAEDHGARRSGHVRHRRARAPVPPDA